MSKQGRNELCHCGSGKKFKRCHGLTSESTQSGRFLMIAVGIGVLAAVAAGVAAFTTDRALVGSGLVDPSTATTTTPTAQQVP